MSSSSDTFSLQTLPAIQVGFATELGQWRSVRDNAVVTGFQASEFKYPWHRLDVVCAEDLHRGGTLIGTT